MKQDRLVQAGILALMAVQLRHAVVVHLNADEALHYLLAHQNTLSESLALTRFNAHPPLLTLILAAWSRIASVEWFLRLIPLLANGALLWFTYRWAGLVLGRGTAVLMTALLAFLPPMFSLATEVRHYTLLMTGVAWGWWALEEAFRRKSARWMAASSAGLAFALLSHFSALFAITGAGLYALFRLRGSGWPRPLLVTWAIGQITLLAILSLFVSQLISLRGSEVTRQARESWLAAFHCQAVDYGCAVSKLGLLLEFFFAVPWLGFVAGLLALAGIITLGRDPRRRGLALLLGATFLAALTAVALGEYPMGASRHSVVTAYVILAAAVVVPGRLLERRPLPLALTIAGTALLFLLAPAHDAQGMPEREQRREWMEAGVAYLRTSVPQGGLVFTDYQSSLLLCYYWDPRRICSDTSGRALLEFDLGGIRVVSSRIWSLDPTPFAQELQVLKRQVGLGKGAEVWVFDAGWGSPVNRPLAVQFGGTTWPGLREFGEHIGVFRIPN